MGLFIPGGDFSWEGCGTLSKKSTCTHIVKENHIGPERLPRSFCTDRHKSHPVTL